MSIHRDVTWHMNNNARGLIAVSGAFKDWKLHRLYYNHLTVKRSLYHCLGFLVSEEHKKNISRHPRTAGQSWTSVSTEGKIGWCFKCWILVQNSSSVTVISVTLSLFLVWNNRFTLSLHVSDEIKTFLMTPWNLICAGVDGQLNGVQSVLGSCSEAVDLHLMMSVYRPRRSRAN